MSFNHISEHGTVSTHQEEFNELIARNDPSGSFQQYAKKHTELLQLQSEATDIANTLWRKNLITEKMYWDMLESIRVQWATFERFQSKQYSKELGAH